VELLFALSLPACFLVFLPFSPQDTIKALSKHVQKLKTELGELQHTLDFLKGNHLDELTLPDINLLHETLISSLRNVSTSQVCCCAVCPLRSCRSHSHTYRTRMLYSPCPSKDALEKRSKGSATDPSSSNDQLPHDRTVCTHMCDHVAERERCVCACVNVRVNVCARVRERERVCVRLCTTDPLCVYMHHCSCACVSATTPCPCACHHSYVCVRGSWSVILIPCTCVCVCVCAHLPISHALWFLVCCVRSCIRTCVRIYIYTYICVCVCVCVYVCTYVSDVASLVGATLAQNFGAQGCTPSQAQEKEAQPTSAATERCHAHITLYCAACRHQGGGNRGGLSNGHHHTYRHHHHHCNGDRLPRSGF
jgi:hypothetical protein